MKARYLFEHQFIPNSLFSDDHGILFLMALTKGKEDFLLSVYRDLWESEETEFPYTQKDISVHPILYEGKGKRPDLHVTAIKMPSPEQFSQCSSVFICFDENMENIQYFTKELSFDSTFMLCSWTAEGHINHGGAPEGNEALFEKISNTYYGMNP